MASNSTRKLWAAHLARGGHKAAARPQAEETMQRRGQTETHGLEVDVHGARQPTKGRAPIHHLWIPRAALPRVPRARKAPLPGRAARPAVAAAPRQAMD